MKNKTKGVLIGIAALPLAVGCGSDGNDRVGAPPAPWGAEVLPAPVATVTATAVEVSAPFDALLSEPDDIPTTEWFVPWEDGFLAIGTRPAEQLLPEALPPEVAELFPPEVTELFPDGLPATQQEAMDILEEAGLLDVVMEILNEHSEAMDAVTSEPMPGPELVAMWSIDGDEWTPTEMVTPTDIGWPSQFAVAGDRLSFVSAVPSFGEAGVDEDGPGPWTVTVASTTDLENWDTAQLTVPVPDGLPDESQMWVSPADVAADDEHWVTRILVDIVDPTSGTPYSEPQSQLWSGAWEGDPTMVESGDLSWVLASTSEGFLDLGRSARFSPDGQTWTDGQPLGPNVTFQAATPLGEGALAITSAPYGDSSILLLDATGTIVDEVEIPELGDRFFVWSAMSSPAFVVEVTAPGSIGRTIIVEHDGFELTQEFGVIAAYQLVDLTTGDVVAQESIDLRVTEIGDDGPFDHLTENERGVTITDPDTGETIVEIPPSVVGRARQAAQDAEETDHWLLATTDGETWLLEQLDGSEPGEVDPPMLTAVNGSTVLTGTGGWEPSLGTWQRSTIPR